MTDDMRLREVLREADAGEFCTVPAGLAERVRRVHKSRLRSNRALAGVAASIAAFGIVWQFLGTGQPSTSTRIAERQETIETNPLVTHNLTTDLSVQDQAELDSQLRIARRVSQILRRDLESPALGRTSSSQQSWQDVKTEFEVVAAQMLRQADELRIAMQPDEPAIVAYQKVVELFPHTPAAEVARGRLAELQN